MAISLQSLETIKKMQSMIDPPDTDKIKSLPLINANFEGTLVLTNQGLKPLIPDE